MAWPTLVALDLEGVLLPEVWHAIADSTGIAELRLTTREVADYDQLMQMRLATLERRQLSLPELQSIIKASVVPLEGASAFLAWLRARTPFIILSDIFLEFVAPVLDRLAHPTIFGNTLSVDPASGRITAYHIRQRDGKRKAIEAFRALGFRTFAAGDSYNDLSMIQAADAGVLFRAPEKIVGDHPDLRACTEYEELQAFIGSDLLAPNGIAPAGA